MRPKRSYKRPSRSAPLAAFIVSPLVLAGINNIGDFNLAGVEGFLAYLFIAFQNGFFWQTIMGRLGPTGTRAVATTAAPITP